MDIGSHTGGLYTEILGTIKIEFLPSDLPRHRNKKERPTSCAFKVFFTEQESDNKEDVCLPLECFSAVAILLLLLKPMPPIFPLEMFRHIPQLHTSGQLNVKRGFIQLRYDSNFVGDGS